MMTAYWFEMVDLIHKLILCSIIVFFPTPAILPVGLAIEGIYIMILLLKTPYLRLADDRLQMLAQFDIFLLLTVQHTYSVEGAPPPGSNVDIALSAFLILLAVFIFCIFVWNVVTYIRSAVWGMRRKIQEEEQRRVVPEPDDMSENGSRYSRPGTPDKDKSPSGGSKHSLGDERPSAVERQTSVGSSDGQQEPMTTDAEVA